MERKIFIVLYFLIFMICDLFSENNRSIYYAYVYNHMDLWKKVIDSIETSNKLTDAQHLELLNYYYGYTAWCIGKKKFNDAKKYIEKSDKLIDKIEKRKYQLSSLYAYKSAFLGFKIAISQFKALLLGGQSIRLANISVEYDSLNPLGFIQLGNAAFYTPKLFGGSKEEALNYYLKALELMEKNRDRLKYNWNYLNLIVNIINTYIELKEYHKAKQYCIKALEIEPEFDWVKNILYPKLLEKT